METGTILLVDDEVTLRQTFAILLQRAGYLRVLETDSVEGALELLHHQTIDVIISDIVLEKATGIDLLRAVRGEGVQIPVVMVTGYPAIETAAEAVRLGAFDYLPKPVKKGILLQVVEKALRRERQRRQEEKDLHSPGDVFSQKQVVASLPEMIVSVDGQLRVTEMNELAVAWCAKHMPTLRKGRLLTAGDHTLVQNLVRDCRNVLLNQEAVAEHRIEWKRKGIATGILSVTAAPLESGVVLSLQDMSYIEDISTIPENGRLHGLVGKSVVMQRLFAMIRQVGPVETTVLITGESGTGKGLVAKALHAESGRSRRPFVHVDCASIPEDVLESELFGHRRGAFTGAEKDRLGRVLQADSGTLFLDELGEISPKMQLRLLRFLQSKVFYPVGRDQPVQVDVRVIAATNADLPKKIAEGIFREDLYYRLRVVDIRTPRLADRIDDIADLASYFLQQFAARQQRTLPRLTERAMECMYAYGWPGNVRELQHVMERAFVFCNGPVIRTEHLPAEMQQSQAPPMPPSDKVLEQQEQIADSLDEVDRLVLALQQAGGNKAKAARILGVDRSTVYRKLVAYDIDVEKCVAAAHENNGLAIVQ